MLGHSIGGAVALDLTMRRPDLVQKLVVVSGGFDSSDEAGPEGGVTDEMVEQTVAFLGESYGAVSPDGQDHFAVVVRVALVWMALELLDAGPVAAWWAITIPTYLSSGLTLRAFRAGAWLKTKV